MNNAHKLRLDLIEQLNSKFASIAEKNINLTAISQWRVGGKAALIVSPKTKQQIIDLRKYLHTYQLPYLVIGNTTNLLFTDEDINAVFIHIGSNFSKAVIRGTELDVQAGIWVPKLARLSMRAGLTGLEHTCGIPGTLGGLIVMNGGSQRKGIGSSVTLVRTVDEEGVIKTYQKEECKFSYRSSVFQKKKEMILSIKLKLEKAESKSAVRKEMLSILRDRNKKFPRKMPNCGSVFVSNPAMYKKYGPPGKIIEESGLKGLRKGGAEVSLEHANFIVNHGNAKATDILYLINKIRSTVFLETGYLMAVETKFVDKLGRIRDI